MATTIKPRFAAQLQNMPLSVITGIDGFRLRYEARSASMVIRNQDDRDNNPLEFADPQEAYRIMREAEGATAALLAGVFGRAVS
jgi:hypothetical protein